MRCSFIIKQVLHHCPGLHHPPSTGWLSTVGLPPRPPFDISEGACRRDLVYYWTRVGSELALLSWHGSGGSEYSLAPHSPPQDMLGAVANYVYGACLMRKLYINTNNKCATISGKIIIYVQGGLSGVKFRSTTGPQIKLLPCITPLYLFVWPFLFLPPSSSDWGRGTGKRSGRKEGTVVQVVLFHTVTGLWYYY